MNKFRFTINALAIAAFTLAFASIAQAQATRTWVSGVGDDANPCSRTAPCKTFAGAISKTAADGEIDALDPGGFGAVTITKPITIDGNGWGSILAAGTNGIIINITSPIGSNTVELRRLSINGAGTGINGIRILSSAANTFVSIESCVIFDFRGTGTSRAIDDERNVAGKLYVQDCLLKNQTGDGLAVTGSGPIKAEFDNVRAISNSIGFHGSQSANTLTARNCVADNNLTGFGADGAVHFDIINCMASHNNTGVNSDSGADVWLGRTTVTRNTTNGLGFSAGTIKSYGNNEVANNSGSNGPFSAGGSVLQ